MKTAAIFGAALLSHLAPVAAIGQSTVTWKDDIAGWYIGVDPSISDGCFMLTTYEKGTFLRVQLNPQTDQIEFIVGDPAWRSIEAGKLYPISIKFGHREPWYGDGRGFLFGADTPAIVVPVAFERGGAELFIDELMEMPGAVIEYDDTEIARLSLRGTYAAMQEVMSCQALMLDNSADSDPFASGTGVGSDPFQ